MAKTEELSSILVSEIEFEVRDLLPILLNACMKLHSVFWEMKL